MESPASVPLCGGRIRLRGRFDLAIGPPGRTPAQVVIVDLKTGEERPEDVADLRYYALLETLTRGVPPYKVASYYLDAGEFRDEEVTEDVLAVAARRVGEGARRLADLWLAVRPPVLTPGNSCRVCPIRSECEEGQSWLAAAGTRGRSRDAAAAE